MTKELDFYDWGRTLSYAADVTMVVTSRGRGKTYGLRKHAIGDFIKTGCTFVEVCRYKNELKDITRGYFDKVGREYAGYMFKTDKARGYIAEKPADGEKPAWRTICYFIALTDAQNAKKRTYDNVRTIIMDEAILDRRDVFRRYLSDEFTRLANVVDTTTRERPDSTVRPHVYLLANACDLLNPYFEAFGIDRIPPYGYSWYNKKNVILHYEEPGDYATEKAANTVAGRMVSATREGTISIENTFLEPGLTLIEPKPARARYELGIVYKGHNLGVWADYREGYLYITNKIPNNATDVFYITREDASINALAARRATPALRSLAEAHYANIIRFESSRIREYFLDALRIFGL